IVLGDDMRVHTANRAFYATFQVSRQETQRVPLYDLGNRQWDHARLRAALHDVVTTGRRFADLEITHEFPVIGRRTMLLSGRLLPRQDKHGRLILLGIEDISDRKAADELLRA